MRKLLQLTCAALACFGLTGMPNLPAVAASKTAPPALPVDPDVDHTGFMKIGVNEPLPTVRHVLIGTNKSMVIELPRDLKDVAVSNPEILDAVVQKSNRVILIGKKLGDANVFFFDENGEQILTMEVRIERDMQVFNRLIERLIPGSHISAEVLNDTMVLSGNVVTPADSARAAEIAARFMQIPGESNATAPIKVINMLQVEAKEQVMLKVVVAEVGRQLIKRLGVNWAGGAIGRDGAFGIGSNNQFPLSGDQGSNGFLSGVIGPDTTRCLLPSSFAGAVIPGSSTLNGSGGSLPPGPLSCFGYTVEAFEQAGLLKTLAEPTLTAISGETASFLAGGEFPVPVGQSVNNGVNEISVEFKPFGVSLSFTPTVMSEGRISLKVATEVSELTNQGAVTISSLTIPALKVRRANTTVELPSGGSMVIGGLISDDTRQNSDGIPGLKTLPILGTLFRSRDFLKKESELMVIITPYMVNPVARDKLVLPTDKLDASNDPKAYFLGEMNRIYGHFHELPEGKYNGNYGFIVE
jgi:pilus assembly protein CpaC